MRRLALLILATGTGLYAQTITTTSPLPNAVKGQPYIPPGGLGLQFQATGFVSTVVWTASPSVPPGMNLSATGLLNGSPSTPGVYNFTINAEGSPVGQSKAFQLTVQPPMSAGPVSLPTGYVGQAYGLSSFSATGGTAPYNYLVTSGFPPGLNVNASTGAITGSPTAAGFYVFDLIVTDSFGYSITQSYSGPQIYNPLSLSPATLPNGVINTLYPPKTVSPSGGQGPYTLTLIGAPPLGMTFNTATGTLSGTPTVAGPASFSVKLTDNISSPPVTVNYSFQVQQPIVVSPATLPTGNLNQAYPVSTFSATGGTPGYSWSIATGSMPTGMGLNTSTGAITGTPTANGIFAFSIRATDSLGYFGTTTYTVQITNPLILTPGTLINGVQNLPYSQQLNASGGASPYGFQVTAGTKPPGLNLDATTGLLNGTPTSAGTYSFTITLTDSISASGVSIPYTIVVQPPLLLNPATLPNGQVNITYPVLTFVGSGGNGPYTFSISTGSMPTGLGLNGATGAITGLPTATGNFTFGITVKDSLNYQVTNIYSNVQIANPLDFTPVTLNNAVQNAAYSQQLTPTGGNGNYTFLTTAGARPPGINLSTSGLLSGTPTAAGSYSFTVTLTDTVPSAPKSINYTMLVQPPIVLSPASMPAGSVGIAYPVAAFSATGGTAPYTYLIAQGALPTGLGLNGATGAITGTPTAAGNCNFLISVRDSLNYQVTNTYNNVQITNPLAISPATVINAVQNLLYSQTLTLSGGNGSYTTQIISGALPAGINLQGTSSLVGIPTVSGAFNFTLQLSDSIGSPVKTAAYTLIVKPPLVLSPATLPNGSVGTPYGVSGFSATGGTPPYTFSVLQGNLPTGMTLNPSTGAFSGTPQVAGLFSFYGAVTDSLGYQVAIPSYNVQIYNPITFIPATLTSGEVGSTYSNYFLASGGSAPYTYTITSGSLPAGLTFDSVKGAFAGSPTTVGTSNFTVQVSDNGGTPPVSRAYSLTILTALSPTPATLPVATLTFPYSQAISAVGGQSPYLVNLVSGTLPSGITYDSSKGVLSGTPTQTGSFPLSFIIADSLDYSKTVNYTLLVTAPLTIAPAALPNIVQGTAFSQPLTSTGGSGAITWSVFSGALPLGLNLNPTTGLLNGTPTTAGAYSVTIQAADAVGTPSAKRTYSGSVIATLQVTTTSLPGGLQGSPYSAVLAYTGGLAPINWTIDSGTLPTGLVFNAATGAISGTSSVPSSAVLLFTAHDSAGQAAGKSLAFSIGSSLAITTTDLPQINTGTLYSFQLNASGGVRPYSWSISSGILPAGLTLSASGLISGTVTTETASTATFRVTDSLGNVDSRQFSFTALIPISPVTITTQALPHGIVNVPYTFTMSASGGQGSYQWTIYQGSLPDGLSFSRTGVISGTPRTASTFTVGIQVSDGPRAEGRLFTIIIDPALAPLAITTQSLPDTDVSTGYTASVGATGGKQPYVFSLASGSLPPGILMDSAGNFTGSATTAGSYSVTVQVQDTLTNRDSKSYTILVIGPLSVTTESLASGNIGVPYSSGVAATGGKQPYKFSVASGSLPPGLSMDDSGAITGKPSKAGSYPLTVQVNDSSRKTASKPFTIKIIDALAITTASPLPDVIQNQNYSQVFSATGGTLSYTWSVAGGTLPAGLGLNATTGELSGRPTDSVTSTFTIQVKDAQGLTANAAFTLKVVPLLAITTTQLANGTVATPYSAGLASTGGTAPVQWSVTSGSLPNGLILSSAGTLSGTPSVNGSFTFTVQAADSQTQKDSKSYTVVIGLPAVAPVAFTGLSSTVSPLQQPILGLNLGTAFPVNLTGTVTLTFVPDSGADDPAVQFTSGGRSAPFSMTAGDPNARFGIVPVGVQTGTVAGAITLTVKLLAGTVDVTPSPVPTITIRIAKAAPVLRTVTVTRTAAGFDVTIVGYVTTRDITTAQFHFTSAAGANVQAVDFTQQLAPVFTTWFQSAASQPFGSQFTLAQPFTISGSATAVTNVTVTMSNSVGTSNAITATIP